MSRTVVRDIGLQAKPPYSLATADGDAPSRQGAERTPYLPRLGKFLSRSSLTLCPSRASLCLTALYADTRQ
jgi:hypothetical protein